MANNGLKDFKGIRGKLSLLGGFLVISADFAMAMFNPKLWTIPWYIIAAFGYIGFIMTIPFWVWLYKMVS
jgi:hypothetical protein